MKKYKTVPETCINKGKIKEYNLASPTNNESIRTNGIEKAKINQ